MGCSPWGREESDTTERLHFHFSLSGIGEGNGNPLQCSCLENPRDRGAWWAAVYGVAQSRTRLKRLSSSSSSRNYGELHSLVCLSPRPTRSAITRYNSPYGNCKKGSSLVNKLQNSCPSLGRLQIYIRVHTMASWISLHCFP